MKALLARWRDVVLAWLAATDDPDDRVYVPPPLSHLMTGRWR